MMIPIKTAGLKNMFSVKAIGLVTLIAPGILLTACEQQTTSGTANGTPGASTVVDRTAEETYDTAVAQYDLGLMYLNGQNVAKDDTQAVSWFRKAAEQGFANAQKILAKYKPRGASQIQTER